MNTVCNTVCDKEPILGSVERYFSAFGFILDKFFKSTNQKVNAIVVLEKLKEKTVDPNKLKTFLDSLPEGRWTIQVIKEKAEQINNLFGISEDEIRKHCVTKVNETDLEVLKWELNIQSMLESSKYANQYYDALKYNQSSKLSMPKMRLLNELMQTFTYIKDHSKKAYDIYENARYSKSQLEKFNSLRFLVDFLWLRVLYVLFNLSDADDEKINRLTRILSMERISVSRQKKIGQKYN